MDELKDYLLSFSGTRSDELDIWYTPEPRRFGALVIALPPDYATINESDLDHLKDDSDS